MKLLEKIKSGIETKQKNKERIYYLNLIEEAKNRISRGRSGFNETSNETLTDYFIYERIAAELHFQYLMKVYTEKNLHISETPILEHSSSSQSM